MLLPGFEEFDFDHDGNGDEWYTPPEVVRAVASLAGDGVIDLDPCHAPVSLTDPRHSIDIRQGGNGITDDWPGDGLVYCNPPYTDVGPWLSRCRQEAARRPVVMLIPARPETAAWWRNVWKSRDAVVVQHRGRLRFVGKTGKRHGSGTLTTCFVLWDVVLAVRMVQALQLNGIEAVAIQKVPS